MIENIFTTPLYYDITSGERLKNIQSEISNCIDKIKIEYNEDWGKTHQLSSLSDDIIEKYNLSHLKNHIDEHLNIYLDGIFYPGKRDYRMESWIAVFNPNDYGHQHDHGNADISGVYYYKTNINDGDIVFYNPTVQADISTVFMGSTWKHKPEEGKMLMFPGYMRHEVQRNTTNDVRISLSWNVLINK